MSTTPLSLADVLRPVKHVFLDFDGPVCSVFAGLPAPEVAQRLRAYLLAAGGQVPTGGDTEADPLALLRLVADTRPDLVPTTDLALAQLEEEAVSLGEPNIGGASVMHACTETGRSVWIVSNNATSAICAYLVKHDLAVHVAGVFGRVHGNPSSMKPNPRLLLDAMDAAGAKATECIFIGDAVRDVEAGHAAGVATIGYANKPGKEARLTAARAVLVVDSMQLIADSLT